MSDNLRTKIKENIEKLTNEAALLVSKLEEYRISERNMATRLNHIQVEINCLDGLLKGDSDEDGSDSE